MPLTFGAAASDNAFITTTQFGSSGQAGLFAGWFYPTTLTTGRYLIAISATSATANYGVQIAATTSQLRLSSNTGTTVGQWTAVADTSLFPSGITANNWWFVAGLVSVVTGPTVAWRIWLGDTNTAPTAMTITQNTSPAGALTIFATTVIGNNSTLSGSASFQGDIGQLTMIHCVSGVNNIIPISSAGTITADEQLQIEQTYIQPLWAGLHPAHYPRTGATNAEWVIFENRQAFSYTRQQLSTTGSVSYGRTDGISTGLSVSQRSEPTVGDIGANNRLPLVRR